MANTVLQSWGNAAKSLLAGVGSTAIFMAGTNFAFLGGGFASFSAFSAQAVAGNVSPIGTLLVGIAVGAVIEGASLFGAYKLFKAAPNRWIAGVGIAGALAATALTPADDETPPPKKPAVHNVVKGYTAQALPSLDRDSPRFVDNSVSDRSDIVMICPAEGAELKFYVAKTELGALLRADRGSEPNGAAVPKVLVKRNDRKTGLYMSAGWVSNKSLYDAIGQACEAPTTEGRTTAQGTIRQFLQTVDNT